MTKFYLIIPCVLLFGFAVFQRDFQQRRIEQEKAQALATARAKSDENRKREVLKEKVAAETRERMASRELQEREKAEKKRRDAEAMLREVESDADRHVADVGRLQSDAATLEEQTADLRSKKQVIDRETFELARRVEEHRIDRRTADIEIQRTARMAAMKLIERSRHTAPDEPAAPAPVRR